MNAVSNSNSDSNLEESIITIDEDDNQSKPFLTRENNLIKVEAPNTNESTTETSTTTMNTSANYKVKCIVLATLTVQNAVLALSMQYSRSRSGPLFLQSTAVFFGEVLKLVICLMVLYKGEAACSFFTFKDLIHRKVFVNFKDTLRVGIPAVLYVFQNNLLYTAAGNLDASTYQITYQLKILTTAMFSILLLNKKLLKTQWLSLVTLVLGIAFVQLSDNSKSSVDEKATPLDTDHPKSRLVGFLASLAACLLSGLAGVYFEKILKSANTSGGPVESLWIRNIQLSFMSIPLSLMTCLAKDGNVILKNGGVFYGYDSFVIYVIMMNAGGGLLVALVVKYADNILKGFACSLAVVLTCIFTIIFYDFQLSLQFTLGTSLVLFAVFLYGYKPQPPTADTSCSSTELLENAPYKDGSHQL